MIENTFLHTINVIILSIAYLEVAISARQPQDGMDCKVKEVGTNSVRKYINYIDKLDVQCTQKPTITTILFYYVPVFNVSVYKCRPIYRPASIYIESFAFHHDNSTEERFEFNGISVSSHKKATALVYLCYHYLSHYKFICLCLKNKRGLLNLDTVSIKIKIHTKLLQFSLKRKNLSAEGNFFGSWCQFPLGLFAYCEGSSIILVLGVISSMEAIELDKRLWWFVLLIIFYVFEFHGRLFHIFISVFSRVSK